MHRKQPTVPAQLALQDASKQASQRMPRQWRQCSQVLMWWGTTKAHRLVQYGLAYTNDAAVSAA
jgi:hypothetical protein